MKALYTKTIFGALLLAFSACSQDEIISGGDNQLPDGAYPLKIGNVSIVAQSSEEPWTRVAENTTDGNSSVWETGDVIAVRFDGAPSYYGGTPPYTVKGEYVFQKTEAVDLFLSSVAGKEIYWKNTYGINSQDKYDNKTWYTGGVTAWYPTDESVVLGDQSERLAYILEGHEKTPDNNGHYRPDDEIPLEFKHLLSKVRVELEGERATAVNKVEVYSYTSCTHSEVGPTLYTRPYRKISTEGAQQGWITMHKATYNDGNTYWEANVVPGTVISDFQLSDGTNTVTCTLTAAVTPVEATLHEITITVNPATVEDGATITESGEYTMSGDYTQGVTINGDNITVTLDGVTISTSGPGINITGGSPTIQVSGENNTITSTTATAINVGNGATVTIEGKTGATDKLTATGGKTQGSGIPGIGNPGAGIGTSDGGNIVIRNVTVDATGATASDYIGADALGAAAIGSANGNCGNITIQNAIINATGGTFSPAIGLGRALEAGTYTIGNILIESSTINGIGGRAASVIGFPYVEFSYGDSDNFTINAGKIVLKTDNADYLSLLTLNPTTASGPNLRTAYKIGKGAYFTTYTTFHNATGNGDWEGVEVYVNNTLSTSSTDGVGQ